MARILDENRTVLLEANKKDLKAFNKEDQALYDRLVVTDQKIDEMIRAVNEVCSQEDPVNKEITSKQLQNRLKVINKTAPFGTILIITNLAPM